MNSASSETVAQPTRHPTSRTLLLTVVLAELLAAWALRAEWWRKAGLGWFFAAVIVAAALIVVAAAGAFRWLIAHRFQFSLKALLVTVLLVGATLGFLERTRKQRNAADILAGLGASVSYAGDTSKIF